MAIFGLPLNFGTIQGISQSYPYLFPFGDDQPQVQVFDGASGQQVFVNAKIMSYSDKVEAQVFQHPMEDGVSFMDHRVTNPNEIILDVIWEKDYYRAGWKEAYAIYKSGQLLTINSRTARAPNLVLMSMPQQQDAEKFDAVPMTFTFRQMKFVVPSQGTMTQDNVSDPATSNTVLQGMKSGTVTAINGDAFPQTLNQAIQGRPTP